MNEPLQTVKLNSFVDEVFTGMPFTNKTFGINAVIPERTFLEKIFLLHEEFAKPQELIRTERMSRHLYDLERIMKTSIADRAMKDISLYKSVIEHRRLFVGLNGFDYDTLAPQTINIIPPESVITSWKEDYKAMQSSMIYGKTLSFDELIDRIRQLNKKVNQIVW